MPVPRQGQRTRIRVADMPMPGFREPGFREPGGNERQSQRQREEERAGPN